MEYPNKNLQELIAIEQARLKRESGLYLEEAVATAPPTFLQTFGLEKVASKVKELTRF